MSSTERAWAEVQLPEGLGLDCGRYKYVQNQTFVEVYVHIPDNIKRDKVSAEELPVLQCCTCGHRIPPLPKSFHPSSDLASSHSQREYMKAKPSSHCKIKCRGPPAMHLLSSLCAAKSVGHVVNVIN